MERLYKLFSMQGKSVIIELPHGPTKFRSISIKPYFIDNMSIGDNQPVQNSSAPTTIQVPSIEAGLAEVPPTHGLPIQVPPASAPLETLTPVKRGRRRPRKYPE